MFHLIHRIPWYDIFIKIQHENWSIVPLMKQKTPVFTLTMMSTIFFLRLRKKPWREMALVSSGSTLMLMPLWLMLRITALLMRWDCWREVVLWRSVRWHPPILAMRIWWICWEPHRQWKWHWYHQWQMERQGTVVEKQSVNIMVLLSPTDSVWIG